MKKFCYRLLPVISLLCLPLFGGYHPATHRESLHLEEAQLAAVAGDMAYQRNKVTRNYDITLIFTAPKKTIIDQFKDFGPLADYRFFTELTNFRHDTIDNKRVIAITSRGQRYIDVHKVGQAPQYAASHTYPGYGRFWFHTPKRAVHDFYGRGLDGDAFPDKHYLDSVKLDMYVQATGSPYEWLPAKPAGW